MKPKATRLLFDASNAFELALQRVEINISILLKKINFLIKTSPTTNNNAKGYFGHFVFVFMECFFPISMFILVFPPISIKTLQITLLKLP